MTDEFVNDLLVRLETMTTDKTEADARLEQLTKSSVEKDQKIAQLEQKIKDLETANQNLRDLVRAKMASQESLPEEMKGEEVGLQRMVSSVDERFEKVTITFKPEKRIDDNDTVSILGEFTDWMPEIMERFDTEQVLMDPSLENTFFYKTRLLKGFKYRYHFSVGDQFVVDPTKEVSADRMDKVTNFVDVLTTSVMVQKSAADQKMKEEAEAEDIDEIIKDLEGDEEVKDAATEIKDAPPLIGQFNMPSFVNKEMIKMLPAEIVQKQGQRVIDSSLNLVELLKTHYNEQMEINDLEIMIKEVANSQNFGQGEYYQTQIDMKRNGMKDVVQKIRVLCKGRLLRPAIDDEILYEIVDYSEKTSMVSLRRLTDPNGILLTKGNTWPSTRKQIRGMMLEKHYKILPQAEEYDTRKKMLSNKDNKVVIKYQVMDIDG